MQSLRRPPASAAAASAAATADGGGSGSGIGGSNGGGGAAGGGASPEGTIGWVRERCRMHLYANLEGGGVATDAEVDMLSATLLGQLYSNTAEEDALQVICHRWPLIATDGHRWPTDGPMRPPRLVTHCRATCSAFSASARWS